MREEDTMLRAATIACLAVPLIAAAPARIDNEGYAWLSDTLMGSHATGGKGEKLEVQSWQWGAAPSGGANQMVVNDTPGNARSTGGHSMLGASDKVTASGSQTESGQATGKRQHLPLRTRVYYDQPLGTGPGSILVKGRLPGCTVGKRYGGMQFSGAGKTYRLQDVRVESCGGGTSSAPKEEITFVYGTLDIR
jgi:hypothetical protein